MYLTTFTHSPSICMFHFTMTTQYYGQSITATKCEPPSYDACAEFAKQFDRLYTGRVEATHPHPNPMRKSNTTFLNQDTNEIFGNIQFPTDYWFDQDERGIIDRTSLGFGDDRASLVKVGWTLVAIGNGGAIPPTGAKGDLSNCPDNNCKLSDDEINALDFDLIKFEPENADASRPVTYFDFLDRAFGSTLSVEACSTPWTLDESKALEGNFDGIETCCDYNVCNFGRGHCGGTVKYGYGYYDAGKRRSRSNSGNHWCYPWNEDTDLCVPNHQSW